MLLTNIFIDIIIIAYRTIYRGVYAMVNMIDKLTGLVSGAELNSHMDALIAKGDEFSFIVLDIDMLLVLNRDYGHEAGDAVLAATASRIERSLSPDMDMMRMLRIGGEEFGVFTGLTSPTDAEQIAGKIISFADEELKWKDLTLIFTLSVGVGRIPNHFENIEQATEAAEKAMVQAKHNGRNTFYRID